jgi:hypothetical protein
MFHHEGQEVRENLTERTQRGSAATKPEKPVQFPSYRRKPVSIPVSFALVKAYAEPVPAPPPNLDSGFRRNDGGATTNLAQKICASCEKS